MKSILMSIKPKWCAKIMNGEKTIEIRKTCPAIFKHLHSYEGASLDVYIYCTKEDSLSLLKTYPKDTYVCEQEFKCDDFPYLCSGYEGKGKVVAKFTLNRVEEIEVGTKENIEQKDYSTFYSSTNEMKLCKASCLDAYEILKYAGYCDDYLRAYKYKVYAWCISNLVIFDKPKELSEFYKVDVNKWYHEHAGTDMPYLEFWNTFEDFRITKAPQSWCYVEVEE